MRRDLSSRTTPLLILACLLILTCSHLAGAQTRIVRERESAVAETSIRITPLTPTSQIQISGKVAGKLHMVVTFLETKGAYSRGVTGDEFVRKALAQMHPAPIPPWLRSYLLRVYDYHVKGLSADAVYATEDGRAFSELYNAAARTYKPGMTKAEFEQQLVPGTSPDYGDPIANKPKWVNVLRKLIDMLDDLLARNEIAIHNDQIAFAGNNEHPVLEVPRDRSH
jgi:hypothetical protein